MEAEAKAKSEAWRRLMFLRMKMKADQKKKGLDYIPERDTIPENHGRFKMSNRHRRHAMFSSLPFTTLSR